MDEPTPPTPDADPAIDGAFEEPAADRTRAIVAIVVVGCVLAAAGLPYLMGFGWFGYRMIVSEEISVYVLNISGQDLTIEVPFEEPTPVPGGTMETLRTLSGPVTVRALSTEGEVLQEVEASTDGPLFYHALGDSCVAVFDVTGFYGGEADISLVATITPEHPLYPIEAHTVVLPRRPLPDDARGDVHWIEPIRDCASLEGDRLEATLVWAQGRLMQRRQEYEEAMRSAEEQ